MQTETARILTIPADDPTSADMVTVTISGTKSADRARVVKVLGHLFSTGGEWDGPLPNVRLIVEHVGAA